MCVTTETRHLNQHTNWQIHTYHNPCRSVCVTLTKKGVCASASLLGTDFAESLAHCLSCKMASSGERLVHCRSCRMASRCSLLSASHSSAQLAKMRCSGLWDGPLRRAADLLVSEPLAVLPCPRWLAQMQCASCSHLHSREGITRVSALLGMFVRGFVGQLEDRLLQGP